ncbi:hypothetical protein D3C71_2163310 [compost metagenome]
MSIDCFFEGSLAELSEFPWNTQHATPHSDLKTSIGFWIFQHHIEIAAAWNSAVGNKEKVKK